MLKVGVIGPSNVVKLQKILGKPVEELTERAQAVGRILAQASCELWVNADGGMLLAAYKEYLDFQGPNLVMLYPQLAEPWPNEHTQEFLRYARETRRELDWFWCNYNVIHLTDLCICVGLSNGTLGELADIGFDVRFKMSGLKHLIGLRELLREGRFPFEIEIEVASILTYLETVEELEGFLQSLPQPA